MQSQQFGRRVAKTVATPWRLAGGSPAATHFLLLRQKKVSKEKATAKPLPAVGGFPNVAGASRVGKQTRCAQTSFPTIPDWHPPHLATSQRRTRQKPTPKQRQKPKPPQFTGRLF